MDNGFMAAMDAFLEKEWIKKNEAPYKITGAGVLSAKSSEIYKTAKGKKQLDSLRKLHNLRQGK